MKFSTAEVEALRELNHKHCPTCQKPVLINTYGINPNMVRVLRHIAKITADQLQLSNERAVDVRATDLTHNERSTLSKLRQHGLLAKHKNGDGTHIAGHWLVTTKGYNFLRGDRVPAKVEIYNNTVLGHPGGEFTDIHEIERANHPADHPEQIKTEVISPAEAAAYGQAREPKKAQTFDAVLCRASFGDFIKGEQYEVIVDGLAFGKPVQMSAPWQATYKDISAFRQDWKIAK